MSVGFFKKSCSFLAGATLLLLSFTLALAGSKEPLRGIRATMVPGEIVVAFKYGHSAGTLSMQSARLLAASRSLGISKKGIHFARIALRRGASLSDTLAIYRNDPAVLTVSPNYLRYPTLTPNDLRYGQVWGLNNTGQTISGATYPTHNPGTADADVDAPEAVM